MPGTRLAARGESLAAFDGRCIPAPPQRGCRVGDPGAGCVAPRSNTPGIATPPRKIRAAGAPVLGRPPSFAGHSRSRELRRDLAEALAEAGRALPAGRLARLGATPDSHHGLLRRQKVLPAGPSLHACGARPRQSLANVAARLLKRR